MNKNIYNNSMKQYSLLQIISIWGLATAIMGLMGWLIAPLVASKTELTPAYSRIIFMTIGLILQFVLVGILVVKETGNLKNLCERLWLQVPINPKTKEKDKKMFLWLIPLMLGLFLMSAGPFPIITEFVTNLLPVLKEPLELNLNLFLESNMDQMAGNWGFFFLFLTMGVFNTFIGEEMLFRGLLLPRMEGTFGQYSWIANGVLFAFYHVALPWNIVAILVINTFALSLVTKIFKSAWFGIILHSGQTVLLMIMLLGIVLGTV